MTAEARILVADDDPSLCLLLRETLQDAGYEVLIANDGDQLVRMAQDDPPDLLLIDLMMPLMDGFEAIRQLRNDTRTSHLPMIILTARSASSEVVIGFDSGADDYIVKPYDLEVLLARIRSHLRRAAKLPVRNPLTGLPGNVLLRAELERQLAQQTPFALIYIDLDNFKAFNDAYGFARGDRAIHLLASVLTEVANREDFLGHIGGDDFAIIHYGGQAEALCERIIATFDRHVRDLYDAVDLQRGYLRGIDRHGVPRQFGMLSLSISVVSNAEQRFESVDAISKVAAEVKQAAKSISGSSYVVDRRTNSLDANEERRGLNRPAALLIHSSESLRAAMTASLRHQGYKSLIAHDVVRAQGLLAHTPDPALLVAETADERVWELWRRLRAPTTLIAVVGDEAAAAAALARGAIAALIMSDNLDDFSEQLVQQIPPADPSLSQTIGYSSGDLLQSLAARNLDLQREANEDSLTLLANRRHVDRRLHELLAQTQQDGRLLCILLADLDHFKQVNDHFGHLLGNEVLRTLADLMRAVCRPADVVARYGGEEFLILLPDTPLPGAVALAERMCETIEQYQWHMLHPQLRITISIGVAEAMGSYPPERADELLDAADRRLYAAKHAGRNRVVAEG
ncbi:MAG: diguanylate cyclase [Oscillochloridaceae bacterium umkhey_bin13]